MTEATTTLAAPASGNRQNIARTAIGLACVYLVADLARLGYSFYETGRTVSLLDNPQPDGAAQIHSLAGTDKALAPLLVLAMLGCLISYFVFLREARTTVQAAGLDPRVVLRHWGVVVWRVAVGVNVLAIVFLGGSLTPSADAPTDVAAIEARVRHAATIAEFGLGIRAVAIVALIGAIFALRGRIRQALTERA